MAVKKIILNFSFFLREFFCCEIIWYITSNKKKKKKKKKTVISLGTIYISYVCMMIDDEVLLHSWLLLPDGTYLQYILSVANTNMYKIVHTC